MGAVLTPEVAAITPAFDKKLHLVSVYASQFKLDAVRADIEASAHLADSSDGLAERFWRIDQLRKAQDPRSLRVDETIIQKASVQLTGWAARHRNAKRIRMLLLVPAGRWGEDMEYVLGVFPQADIDAYITSTAAAEVAKFDNPRISVQHVDPGTRAWVFLGLRLVLTRPTPTIFLAGEKRIREARFLSAFWPMSDPIVVPTMDHLVSGLRRAAAANESHHSHS